MNRKKGTNTFSHAIQIDQSGKIENMSKYTVVAFSNDTSKAVLVRARTKRQLQEMFRKRGKIRLFIYRTFAALIFLLIKDELSQIKQIVIDTEYPGKEKLIERILLEYIRLHQLEEPAIYFQRVGNKSKVHYASYDVFTGKKKPNKIIELKELQKLAIKNDR